MSSYASVYARVPRPALFLVRESQPESSSHDGRPDDAPLDDDQLDDLACEITTLAAHIHAALARFLELIAAFDRCRGWEREGHRSCADWLAFRTGIDLGASREKVRAARALETLPQTSAAMARGELSFSKVRALTRVATPENEADLLELARGCTTARTERLVRAWKKHARAEERDVERELHASRTLSVFPDDEGMYVIRGKLPAEVGALLMRAIEAASDAIYRGEDAPGEGRRGGRRQGTRGRGRDADTTRAAARRRADALALLAERAMAAGFGGEDEASAPVSGTRAERYQVMLHVAAETLTAEGEPGGCRRSSHLEDGTRISAETSRRLACDAAVVRIGHGSRGDSNAPGGDHAPGAHHAQGGHDAPGEGDAGVAHDAPGEILSVGRRTRTIPPALRRALDARDRGCRFPGCGLRFTDAHHIKHWADGGETSMGNCLLLCRHHHRLMHEGGWRVVAPRSAADAPTFIDPRGGTHWEGRWRAPELEPEVLRDAAAALAERTRRHGADPGPWTASARWKTERDIPIEVWGAAFEALA